jgi:drug/metabolite transporter (DMT)-like permease
MLHRAIGRPSSGRLSAPGLAFLLLAAVSLCWGINWPIMKVALAEVPVWSFRLLCTAAGAAGLLGIAWATGQRIRVPRRQWGRLILIAIPNVTLWNIFGAYGLTYLPSGRAVILAFTMPLWAVILSALILGERLSRARLLGLGLGMAAMAVLMGHEIVHAVSAPLGSLLMIGAALSWGGGTVMLKRFPIDLPTASLSGWLILLGGLPMIAGALFLDPPIAWPIGTGALAAVAYNMLVAFIFCYWAWFKAVSLVPASTATLGSLMIPVIGTISGALALGEHVGWQEGLALILVVGAVLSVIRPGAARA